MKLRIGLLALVVTINFIHAGRKNTSYNKKDIKWDDARGHRIVIVSNITEQSIKVKMENIGKQHVTVKTEPKRSIQLQTYWEQESEWKTVKPKQFRFFPVPVHYALPKNESVPSIEYRYTDSYLLVRADHDQSKEGERLKNKKIHLKKAVVDQAWYQIKLKNSQFAVLQKNQKKVE